MKELIPYIFTIVSLLAGFFTAFFVQERKFKNEIILEKEKNKKQKRRYLWNAYREARINSNKLAGMKLNLKTQSSTMFIQYFEQEYNHVHKLNNSQLKTQAKKFLLNDKIITELQKLASTPIMTME